MTRADRPVVLIVEDEPAVAEGYELLLQDDYQVEIATGGREALKTVDDDVDVVLLDRMMPELSGKEVLDEIRARELDCRVAMVTAVEPDFDIVEMGFDAYVTKPPTRDRLHDTVERLLERATLDDELREYYSLLARQSMLETEKPAEALEASDNYADLVSRIEAKSEAVKASLGEMSSDTDFVGAVREITDDEGS